MNAVEQKRRGRRPGKAPATLEAAWARDVQRGDNCWAWTGPIASNGYGRVSWLGQRLYAHRVSYELHVGPIPVGKVIDHLCRTPLCVNPAHLEPVTIAENSLRGVAPSIRRHHAKVCIRGHEQTGANVYRSPAGRRNCAVCQRERHIGRKP